MNKMVKETAITIQKTSDYGERFTQNLQLAFTWTKNPMYAHSIAEAIKQEKSILILGGVGSGKTKLVSNLIRMSDPNRTFRYLYRSKLNTFNDYEMPSELQSRIEHSINLLREPSYNSKNITHSDNSDYWAKPNFYVIDDILLSDLPHIVNQIKNDIDVPMIATCQASNRENLEFINMNISRFFDMLIVVESYQNISHVLVS